MQLMISKLDIVHIRRVFKTILIQSQSSGILRTVPGILRHLFRRPHVAHHHGHYLEGITFLTSISTVSATTS